MSYQALYRKYRPASFDELVGQKYIIQTLKNAIERDRIGHAYLFCGPRGTGKTSIAKIFARTLNCTGEHKPCMECENCKASLNGSHPDIYEIDAASNNGVDDVRDLIERVSYAPMIGKYKVYIIDEVHMMTQAAFNALLKTIEEPPEHVVFIFATTEPNKVLPTILSRCQRYDFSEVSEKDIVQKLTQVCESEAIDVQPEAIDLIAELAHGGMRDALSILDQCVAYEPDHLSLEAVREIYGVVQTDELAKVISWLNPEHMDEALTFLEEIDAKGFDLKRFVSDLISLLKDSLVYDMAKNSALLSKKKRLVIEEYLADIPSYKRMRIATDLLDLYNKLGYASNVVEYIETALLKSAFYENQQQPAQSYDSSHISNPQNIPTSENHLNSYSEPPKPHTSREKPNLRALLNQSDVSRETFMNRKKDKSEITFTEDFLLSLLVGANKELKKSDSDHMKELDKYLTELTFAKFASAMKGASIGASGPTYMLLAVGSILEKENLNTLQNTEGFETFTNTLLGTPKKIFAITSKEMKDLIQAFRTRSASKSLPAPAEITASLPKTEKEPDLKEELSKRFPNLIITDD